MRLPTDLCRWCGHERRHHGNALWGCRVPRPAAEAGTTACPCTRFRPLRRWLRKVKG